MKHINYTALRFPGGKTRALKQILPIIPTDFIEFREPMVGGGSVFFALKQKCPERKFWINDINEDLYLFWKYRKTDSDRLIKEIKKIKERTDDGQKLFLELTDPNKKFTEFERAVRFFILNRITFSGTVESGGYSKQSFEKRFTDSTIGLLSDSEHMLKNVKITNLDYEKVINKKGKNIFIFLDPPYLSKSKSKLYGKNGKLHTSFDHERFARNMEKCKHKWLITYDNCQEIKELFPFANIYEWELRYGMNNYKQKSVSKGQELFISNYEI
ncbi:modification methylase [Methanosarcinales archaeon ex4572_44]|nr:MAG: modification methylase [Methanosarcinales archaeon ex4572_44]